jgi:phosphoribosyl 1,2-cyclic phosphodiesterase
MKLKFWGTRGSIPTPLPTHMKYGGDTSCVELLGDDGTRIIFDAGTGLRRLGLNLLKNPPADKQVTICLSHTHWDHIQGFPFFLPIYNPEYRFKIYAPMRADAKMEMRLHVQMSDLFFPVNLKQLEDRMQFISIVEEEFKVGSLTVLPRNLFHPMGCFGYRVTDPRGKVVVYMTDNEHVPGEPPTEDTRILAENADVLIWDAHFTDEEFPKYKGWGHSTWEEGVRVSKALNVKKLVLFHHDPNHDDAFIDKVVADAEKAFPGGVVPATRDLEIEV